MKSRWREGLTTALLSGDDRWLDIQRELMQLRGLNQACYEGHGHYYATHLPCLGKFARRLDILRIDHEQGELLRQTSVDLSVLAQCGEPLPYTPVEEQADFVTPILDRLRERFPHIFSRWEDREAAAAESARRAIEAHNGGQSRGLHIMMPWQRAQRRREHEDREAAAATRNSAPPAYSADLRPSSPDVGAGGGDASKDAEG